MKRSKDASKKARIVAEIIDDLDNEFELELSEDRVALIIDRLAKQSGDDDDFRGVYFRELLRLQKELVKLQDWVVHKGLKVVVIFEGRVRLVRVVPSNELLSG